MIYIRNFSLSILLLITFGLSARVELNDATDVVFEVMPDKSLSMYIDLGHIEIQEIVQNGKNFISLSVEGQYFTNQPGEPRLPQINNLIEIPYGSDPRIEIVN